MIDFTLHSAVSLGIVLLLVIILCFKIQAFIVLLIDSITVGIFPGMQPLIIILVPQGNIIVDCPKLYTKTASTYKTD